MLALLLALPARGGEINVCFSPGGGCTQAITNEPAQAKRSVLVQAYNFTSAPIARALVEAHRRGVKVEVILDKSGRTGRYSSADFLRNSGVPTFIDSRHPIAHNKIMVIDGEVELAGSFNGFQAASVVSEPGANVAKASGAAGIIPSARPPKP